jgi:hypothetical protein
LAVEEVEEPIQYQMVYQEVQEAAQLVTVLVEQAAQEHQDKETLAAILQQTLHILEVEEVVLQQQEQQVQEAQEVTEEMEQHHQLVALL